MTHGIYTIYYVYILLMGKGTAGAARGPPVVSVDLYGTFSNCGALHRKRSTRL
jgi:hypothetical protein